MVAPAPADTGRVPARYWLWLGGTTLSLAGNQALAFGLAWSASALSATLAGLVLTAVVLPRTLLLLVGGAVADRVGVWRVLLAGDAVMLAATAGLVVVLQLTAPTAALLLATALVVGVVDAFYLPASGTLPRRLAPGAALPRAMAARQLAGQLAAAVGGPLGGLLVGAAGLTAAALFDAGSFALVLVVLLAMRPLRAEETVGAGTGRLVREGLRAVAADRVLVASLGLVAAAAAALLPASSLLVPLLGRARGWSPGATGAVVGAVAVGTTLVAAAVLARRGPSRPGVAAPAGLLLAAAALAGLALPVPQAAAVVLGTLTGLGTGLFTASVGPLVLGRGPASHLSRIQAAVGLAQSLPLLAGTPLLGSLADRAGPPAALAGCAALLAVAAGTALASPTLRDAG